jgi:hypothetical protein
MLEDNLTLHPNLGNMLLCIMPRLPTQMGNQKYAYKEDLGILTAIIDVGRNWSRHQRFCDATDGRSSPLVYKYAMALQQTYHSSADRKHDPYSPSEG